jgi:hypothetical protein
MGIEGLRSAPLAAREAGLLRFFHQLFAPAVRKEHGSEVSNEKKEIKVNDKRMFTSDGVLKEEYRFLDEKSTAPPASAEPEPAAPEPPPPPPQRQPDAWPPESAGGYEPGGMGMPGGEPPLDLPGTSPEMGGPSFYDLVAMMAEPVPIYLGDARLPDGQVATDLEMARLHIDLLDVLRQKTAGNLTAQERAFLEDLLYRLRVRYVQKRG